MSLKCAPLIEKIKGKIAAADPNPANRKVLSVFNFIITDDGKQVKQYTMDLKKLELYEGAYSGKADVTITGDDTALALMGAKQLTQEDAIQQGKLKFEGDAETIKKIAILTEKMKEQ